MSLILPFSFLSSNKNRKKFILLHGSALHLVTINKNSVEISFRQLLQEIKLKPKPILLLAAPFVNTFIHETIPLSPQELEQVDEQVLPFSPTARENRLISSFELSDQKALTIHSHLTLKGTDLLTRFKEKKAKVNWQPAILTLAENLLSIFKTVASSGEILRFYLNNEILQIQWESSHPNFKHLSYWQQHLDFLGKKQSMDKLLEQIDGKQKIIFINLFSKNIQGADVSTTSISDLCFPKGKQAKFKKISRSVRKETVSYLKKVKLNWILAMITVCFVIWAFFVNFQVKQLINEQSSLRKSIQSLQLKTDKLASIAKTERRFFQLSSLLRATSILKFKPHLLLEKIEAILPSNIWIHKISISAKKVNLELLDNEETELTALMELFGNKLGKTSLDLSETIQIKDNQLKKYYVLINPLLTEIMHEKMVKKTN